MNDLIDRQKMIDLIEDDSSNGVYSCFASYKDAQKFKQKVMDLSPTQPERKRGRWTLIGMKKYKTVGRTPDQKEVLLEKEWRREEKIQCSCCGEITMLDYSITYQFCPHCGADMREDNHETD